MNKTCTKCGVECLATVEYFYKNPHHKDGLTSACKKCRNKQIKQWQQSSKGKESNRKHNKKYRQTFKGYLRCVFLAMRDRCTKPRRKGYKNYGGRGIENKFKDFNGFFGYVTTVLGITELKQVKGLDIDRINNDGHYEPGNVRWTTRKENIRNQRPRKPSNIVRNRDNLGKFV